MSECILNETRILVKDKFDVSQAYKILVQELSGDTNWMKVNESYN